MVLSEWADAVSPRHGRADANELVTAGFSYVDRVMVALVHGEGLRGGPPRGVCVLGNAAHRVVSRLLAPRLKGSRDLGAGVMENTAEFGGRGIPMIFAAHPVARAFNRQSAVVTDWLSATLR